MKKKETETKNDAPKKALLKSLIGAALLVALGALLMLRPDFATNDVALVLGWIFIVGGAILIAVDVLNWDVLGLSEMLVGIVAVAVGLFVVIRPDFLASHFGTLIGIYLGFQSFLNLTTAVNLKKNGKIFMPTLVLGFVLLALALILVFGSLDYSDFLVRFMGVLMIIAGLSNLVLQSKFFTDRTRAKSEEQSKSKSEKLVPRSDD